MLGGGNRVTSGDVVNFCRGTDDKIDYAVPQEFHNKMVELDVDTVFVWSYQKRDGRELFGCPVALGHMILEELHSGNAVLLKTEEYESLVTQLDIARKILKIHRGEKIEDGV